MMNKSLLRCSLGGGERRLLVNHRHRRRRCLSCGCRLSLSVMLLLLLLLLLVVLLQRRGSERRIVRRRGRGRSFARGDVCAGHGREHGVGHRARLLGRARLLRLGRRSHGRRAAVALRAAARVEVVRIAMTTAQDKTSKR